LTWQAISFKEMTYQTKNLPFFTHQNQ